MDELDGVVLTPPNMPMLHYMPLKDILEEKTGLPVYVRKDTNAIAFAEQWYGEDKHADDLTYIDVDMGIGAGLIIHGQLNSGANTMAGELGHITIDYNGPMCNCGNRGCLEAVSSGLAIICLLYTSFQWCAPDGSNVVAGRIPYGYGSGGGHVEEQVHRSADNVHWKCGIGISYYGVGNHGGGPTIRNIAVSYTHLSENSIITLVSKALE